MNNIPLNDFFNLKEFESPDTHEVVIDNKLWINLNLLRNYYKMPITISSGYRTKNYNIAIGGSFNSYHLCGKAVDIVIPLHDFYSIICFSKDVFSGIIVYPLHIHLDVRAGGNYHWNKNTNSPL